MATLAQQMGESTLFARTGGAPSLAVGMATLFAHATSNSMLALWYHFAIMFEALFILTTLDAGTRVGRFLLQDTLGNVMPAFKRTSWLPGAISANLIFCSAWGYFLYMGTQDPLGGINGLWPLFGISNQMLGVIALSIGTAILVKSGKIRYVWTTAVPLLWMLTVTTTAAWQKLFSSDVRLGFLAHAESLQAIVATRTHEAERLSQLIFNDYLNAGMTLFFLIITWIMIAEMARLTWRYLHGYPLSLIHI